MKLDRLCDLVAAQLGGEAQGAVDACCDARGKDPSAIHHYALVDGDRAEIGQQVKRRPVGRRPASLEQARRAADQGACAHRENAARARRLPTDPIQYFGVDHQGLLEMAARHMKDIQSRRIGEDRVRRKP
jgi:hypothetical protein